MATITANIKDNHQSGCASSRGTMDPPAPLIRVESVGPSSVVPSCDSKATNTSQLERILSEDTQESTVDASTVASDEKEHGTDHRDSDGFVDTSLSPSSMHSSSSLSFQVDESSLITNGDQVSSSCGSQLILFLTDEEEDDTNNETADSNSKEFAVHDDGRYRHWLTSNTENRLLQPTKYPTTASAGRKENYIQVIDAEAAIWQSHPSPSMLADPNTGLVEVEVIATTEKFTNKSYKSFSQQGQNHDNDDHDQEAQWLPSATFDTEQSRESHHSSFSQQSSVTKPNPPDSFRVVEDVSPDVKDDTPRKELPKLVRFSSAQPWAFLKKLYEILGVCFDVIFAIAFVVAFRRNYENHQGTQGLLFFTLFLPGTVLTMLWMRHQFPMETTMACWRAKPNNEKQPYYIHGLYGAGLFLLSFLYSWFLLPIFTVADFAAVWLGSDVYAIFLRILPQDYLQVRRLVYAICQDVCLLGVQFYVMSTPRGMPGSIVGLTFTFTVLNLAACCCVFWQRHKVLADSQVSMAVYVKNLLGLVPKDARFAAAYADMLRNGNYPYEHIILQDASLDDGDVISLVDALVHAANRNKKQTKPRKLQLSANNLSDISVSHIAWQVSRGCLPYLELLDVSNNKWGDATARGLANCLLNGLCPRLRALNIEDNNNISQEGYNALARAIRTVFHQSNLPLEVLVMDHRGEITELLREVCVLCNVETFFPVTRQTGRRKAGDLDSEATVVGSVRMASRYFHFGKQQY